MPKYARVSDDELLFESNSRGDKSANGYTIAIDVTSTNVGFTVGEKFCFALDFHYTNGWDDFVTIINYIDQVILKTKD